VWASELAIVEMQTRHKECPQCNTWAWFWSEKKSEQILQVINGVITPSMKGCPTWWRILCMPRRGVSATGSTLECRLFFMINRLVVISRFWFQFAFLRKILFSWQKLLAGRWMRWRGLVESDGGNVVAKTAFNLVRAPMKTSACAL
jgi:hypothetical protein